MKYKVQYRDKKKIRAFREVVIEADDTEAAKHQVEEKEQKNIDIVSVRPWDPGAVLRKAILIAFCTIALGGLLIGGLISWAAISPWIGSSPASWH